jgi:hypothetical protein
MVKNVLVPEKNDNESIDVFRFWKYMEASSCDENWYSRPVITDLIDRLNAISFEQSVILFVTP